MMRMNDLEDNSDLQITKHRGMLESCSRETYQHDAGFILNQRNDTEYAHG